jgi:hypothetical protein
MKATTGESALEQAGPVPESGIHPTARCLAAGGDLRAALLLLRDDAPKSALSPEPERDDAPKVDARNSTPSAR